MRQSKANLIIATSILLGASFASAQTPVYGGFVSYEGVTQPMAAPAAPSGQARQIAVDNQVERRFGSFEHHAGVALPHTPFPVDRVTHADQPGSTPTLRFGRFASTDGITIPIGFGVVQPQPVEPNVTRLLSP